MNSFANSFKAKPRNATKLKAAKVKEAHGRLICSEITFSVNIMFY